MSPPLAMPSTVSGSYPERDIARQPMPTYCRALSENELSYFLPSRAEGVNDMSLRIGFRAPTALVTPLRVAIVWAIIRLRHPLLASHVRMTPGVYNSAQFVYTPPSSSNDAIFDAKANSEIRSDRTADELLDIYINGPRTLSAKRTSYLYIVPKRNEDTAEVRDYDMIIGVAHFVCDGVGVHSMGNLFFSLLGGTVAPNGRSIRSDMELAKLLDFEWTKRWAVAVQKLEGVMVPPTESRLPPPVSKLQAAALKVDFKNSQRHYIGGHVFPRKNSDVRRTVVSDIIFDSAKTAAILAKCRAEGVTIQHALFVLCNFAWIRTCHTGDSGVADGRVTKSLPTMMYSAINLRPYLLPTPSPLDSYMFLAVAYFNIVLPAFLPSTKLSAIFWHRSRSVKSQIQKYISSPMLVARTQIMSSERANRARKFAKEDDEILTRKDGYTPSIQSIPIPNSKQASFTPKSPQNLPPTHPAPAVALLGFSQMGNLDDIYRTGLYPGITLTCLMSNTRKARGGMLMFSYSFRGCLYLSLSWDAPAFREGVVEEFLGKVQSAADEFLVGDLHSLHKL